jgi:hypothetical protein
MTKAEVRACQRAMNRFTAPSAHYLHGINPVRVDGVKGASTNGRIRTCKKYLGYREPINARITHEFIVRLNHPKNRRYPGRMEILNESWRLRLAANRRSLQRKRSKQSDSDSYSKDGIVRFDGRPCAKWMVPRITYARRNGWRGYVVSAYRTPEYSEQLCYNMCGRPSCPGRCAGRNTNHAKYKRPGGALDVSYYYDFGSHQRRNPAQPRIWNALGAQDPVHFSVSGR